MRASAVSDQHGIQGPGSGSVVLAYPEGDELCMLRSDAEVAAQG